MNNSWRQSANSPLVIALVVVVVLLLLFGGGAMSGRMMNSGLNERGWMGDRNWMWTPTLVALCIGVVLGWVIFKKKA